MRVVAGKARSLQLMTVPGMDVRPTTDRIKETLFNMITTEVPGGRFLDLFAGSGGIGIEALSRGAKKAYFIENNTAAHKCILDNLNHCINNCFRAFIPCKGASVEVAVSLTAVVLFNVVIPEYAGDTHFLSL